MTEQVEYTELDLLTDKEYETVMNGGEVVKIFEMEDGAMFEMVTKLIK